MLTSNDGTIQHEAPAQKLASPPSEKSRDIDHSTEEGNQALTEDVSDTKKNQYTLITQLWGWMAGTSPTCATFPSHPHSHTSSLHTANDKTRHSSDPPSPSPSAPSTQEALPCIIDEPREPGFKHRGSAPSRGTHRDYPATRDALWTGGGHRAVPDGLRKLAAGDDGRGQDDNQSAAPSGSGS